MKSVIKNLALAACVLGLLAGCALGPNFKKPAPPSVKQYTASPITSVTETTNVLGGGAQHLITGADVSGQWWTLFHSKALNALIDRALKANPDLKAGQAALLVAKETLRAQNGAYYPSANASFSASRQKQSDLLAPIPNANVFTYNLFTPQVAVSYSPDIFGLNRRTVESLKAQAQAQRYALAATFITLTANVVNAAVNEASLRAQISATTNLIEANTKALDILCAQFANGYINRLDLAAQESQLAQVEATLPPLRKLLAQQRDALAVLVGAFPSEDPAEMFDLSNLQLPADLPLSLPSKLVEQRPDVLQAEENMHEACAEVGIAAANRVPNIALTADVGSTALSIDRVFTSGTGFWGVSGALTQPLFDGGTLMHKHRAAKAALLQANEQYRGTVLGAFQNVADTLNALQQDGDALKKAADAERAAKATMELTQQRLRAGYINYLALTTAETACQQAEVSLVQAQANRYADTAALFLALGGGWWNHTDFTKY